MSFTTHAVSYVIKLLIIFLLHQYPKLTILISLDMEKNEIHSSISKKPPKKFKKKVLQNW